MAGQMGSQDRRRSWQPNFLRRCPSVALRARHEAHASPPDDIGVSSFSYNTPQEWDSYSSKPIDERDYYRLHGLGRRMYHASYLDSYVYSCMCMRRTHTCSNLQAKPILVACMCTYISMHGPTIQLNTKLCSNGNSIEDDPGLLDSYSALTA